jgi:hypothetical protein
MTPYDRAWDIAVYTEYISSYDGICQVVRIPDGWGSGLKILGLNLFFFAPNGKSYMFRTSNGFTGVQCLSIEGRT